MLIRSVFCLGLVLLAACGKDEPKAKPLPKADAQVRSTVATLAPADSAVIVQCASASRLTGMIRSMGDAFGAETPPDPLAMMFGGTGVDGSKVDPNKPMALAASFDKDRPAPSVTWILPFEDAAAASAAHQGGSRVEGQYAALTASGEIGKGGCSLADGLLAGDISMRVDVKSLVAIYREEIDFQLETFDQGFQEAFRQASGKTSPAPIDPTSMSKAISDGIRAAVDSVETVDCVVHYGETGRLDLDFGMEVAAGSPLDDAAEGQTDLAALASHLRGDFPCVLLFRFDMKGYMDMFGGMLDGVAQNMPEEKRAGFQAYLDRSVAVMDHLEDGWAMALDMSGEGIRAVMIAGAKDGPAYVDAYRELIASPELAEMGMSWSNASERTVSGTQVHSGSFQIDFVKYMSVLGMDESGAAPPGMVEAMSQFFGKDGMLFELAAKDGLVYMTIGGDVSLMDEALAEVKPPLHLDQALARLPGRSDFLLYVDFRGFLKGVWDLVNQFGDESFELRVPDGPPLPLTMTGATEGRVQRLGVSLELKQVADFFKSIQKSSKRR